MFRILLGILFFSFSMFYVYMCGGGICVCACTHELLHVEAPRLMSGLILHLSPIEFNDV